MKRQVRGHLGATRGTMLAIGQSCFTALGDNSIQESVASPLEASDPFKVVTPSSQCSTFKICLPPPLVLMQDVCASLVCFVYKQSVEITHLNLQKGKWEGGQCPSEVSASASGAWVVAMVTEVLKYRCRLTALQFCSLACLLGFPPITDVMSCGVCIKDRFGTDPSACLDSSFLPLSVNYGSLKLHRPHVCFLVHRQSFIPSFTWVCFFLARQLHWSSQQAVWVRAMYWAWVCSSQNIILLLLCWTWLVWHCCCPDF